MNEDQSEVMLVTESVGNGNSKKTRENECVGVSVWVGVWGGKQWWVGG